MKNQQSLWPVGVLLVCMMLGISTRTTRALGEQPFKVERSKNRQSEASQTPLPTQTETPEVIEMTEERLLPPVGGNAGLVLGASVLVLIILGGVMLFSRRKSKH